MAFKLITSDPDQRDIRMVWLLNLVPYLGLGYLYAVGTKGLKPIMMLWVFEFIFGAHLSWLWIYLLVSSVGTVELLAMRSPAKKLANRQTYFDKRINPPATQTQTPLAGGEEEHALPTLERKAKRAERALKKLSSESLDKSKYAVDSFEYKAQAAEKTLGAAEDSSEIMTEAPDVMPEDQPFFSKAEMAETQKLVDQNSNGQANFSDGVDTSASQISENAPFFNATEAAYPKGSDDYSQNKTPENQPFFTASEVANAKGLNDYSQNQTPENQPFFTASEVANAKSLDNYDRSTRNDDLSNELSQPVNFEMPKNEMALPTTNALDIELPPPEPLPELAPELRIPIPNVTPGMDAVVTNSSITDFKASEPDTTISAVPAPVAEPSPEISLGNFEAPKFEFSFDDHLSTNFEGAASSSASESIKCPKCGAAKNSSFSFCLSCGHSYDENAST